MAGKNKKVTAKVVVKTKVSKDKKKKGKPFAPDQLAMAKKMGVKIG